MRWLGALSLERLVFGDDPDAFGLHAQGDDLALEIVADLLERTDVSHVTSPCCFEPATTAASMAICRPRTIDDAPATGRSAAEDGGRSDFLASRGMGEAQGKKVASDGVAAQTIEAQPVFGQIKPSQRPGASRAEHASSGEDVADLG